MPSYWILKPLTKYCYPVSSKGFLLPSWASRRRIRSVPTLECLRGDPEVYCLHAAGLASLEDPRPRHQGPFLVIIATFLPLQKSMPAEEAHFINTKQLKFLLARSRWQVSPPSPRKEVRRPGKEGYLNIAVCPT